jgi:hypothetical protein
MEACGVAEIKDLAFRVKGLDFWTYEGHKAASIVPHGNFRLGRLKIGLDRRDRKSVV